MTKSYDIPYNQLASKVFPPVFRKKGSIRAENCGSNEVSGNIALSQEKKQERSRARHPGWSHKKSIR